MKHTKILLRLFTVLAILALLTLPVLAEDCELKVYPTETTGLEDGYGESLMALVSSDPVPTFTITDEGLQFIISFEGFSAMPQWDYAQYSIGHGNNYEAAKELFGEDCAPITEEQAFILLKTEIVGVETFMNNFFAKNHIVLNQNQYDALLSFTYNVGIGWTTYKNSDGTWCMLKEMLLDDPSTWTAERAQKAFGSWVKAGGQVLPGLVKRRAAEATMFCTPYTAPEDNDSGTTEGGDSEDNGDVNDTPEADPPETTTPDGDSTDTGSPVPDAAPDFSDVAASAWYYDAVMDVCGLGLMQGMGHDSFAPDETLTRAQTVKILANFDGVTDLSQYTDAGFSDVSEDAWYAGVVAWAVEKGYVNGYDDGTFRPEDSITREQLCTILSRYLTDKGFAVDGAFSSFADHDKISSYAREHVYFCTMLGLIQGVGDNAFSPTSNATRAQAATILLRMCGLG